MNKNYSEKEIMVFQGVMKLMSKGIKLHTVKVSDIAISAGIGKGTIYDYFKSKEEIIGRSMLYAMELELIAGLKKISEEKGFKDKCYTALKIIEKSVKDNNSTTRLLLSNIGSYELSEFLKDNFYVLEKRKQILSEAMDELAALGIKEGLIKDGEDIEYTHTVFMSVALGFSNSICNKKNENEEELAKVRNRAYKMLLKAFN